MTYSQQGEEDVLLAHFGGRTGKLLDIGAFDGRAFSNTLALLERGWEGVLVEPSARAFDKLRAEHAGRDEVTLVQALVQAHEFTDRPNLVEFHQCADALSTTEQSNLDIWEPSGTVFQSTWVPALPLYDLLLFSGGMRRPFEFVNIDTEGTSMAILRALLHHCQGQLLPEVICVEYDGQPVQAPEYSEVYRNGTNVILVRK